MIPQVELDLLPNPGFDADAPYSVRERRVISLEAHRAAVGEISKWPGYAPTPLVDLGGLADSLGVAAIHYKDEGPRFGLGSFKALGGAYAVLRALQRAVAARTGATPTSGELVAGAHRDITGPMTVTTATDGNHGRSVAWGARMFGCRAVIYLPEVCSPARECEIARHGAEIVRTPHGYDGAVAQCLHDAGAEGRLLIADTSVEGGDMVAPRDVTQGYTVIMEEALAQMGDGAPPTHVFVQGGVGALPAAVCGYLAEAFEAQAPRVIVVEPDGAACLFASGVAGRPVALEGDVHSVMAGLNCGTASPLAWEILGVRTFAFARIPDDVTAPCMQLLADSPFGDPPVVAGESAIAGLAGFLASWDDPGARSNLGLTPDSRVLLFGTEGDTDPEIFEAMVGVSADEVRRRAPQGSS